MDDESMSKLMSQIFLGPLYTRCSREVETWMGSEGATPGIWRKHARSHYARIGNGVYHLFHSSGADLLAKPPTCQHKTWTSINVVEPTDNDCHSRNMRYTRGGLKL